MKNRCPHCGYEADCHTDLEGATKPRDGDASFCISCGGISEFRNGQRIKAAMDDFPADVRRELFFLKDTWVKTDGGRA